MSNAASPESHHIVELAYGFRAAKVLMSAVELGIFTALAAGPLSLDALTTRVGIHPRGARDFLDALVVLKLLHRDEQGRYGNSADADLCLDSSKVSYIGGLLEHISGSEYPCWSSLTAALRTGLPQTGASERTCPTSSSDVPRIERFVRGMTGATLPVARVLARQFPWREFRTFVDIGTAQGCVPVAIAQANAHIRGLGFDLPAVRTSFEHYVAEHGVAGRLSFQSGDFLTDRLPEADVLILGRVLHNWDLPTKQALLRNAHSVLPAGGALLVYERLVDDSRANAAGLLSSLNMLVMTPGGFDFTAAECLGWMHAAGFRDTRVEKLTADHSLVVGYKD